VTSKMTSGPDCSGSSVEAVEDGLALGAPERRMVQRRRTGVRRLVRARRRREASGGETGRMSPRSLWSANVVSAGFVVCEPPIVVDGQTGSVHPDRSTHAHRASPSRTRTSLHRSPSPELRPMRRPGSWRAHGALTTPYRSPRPAARVLSATSPAPTRREPRPGSSPGARSRTPGCPGLHCAPPQGRGEGAAVALRPLDCLLSSGR